MTNEIELDKSVKNVIYMFIKRKNTLIVSSFNIKLYQQPEYDTCTIGLCSCPSKCQL